MNEESGREITVRVVRSRRKTIGLHITKDGNAEVRAPYFVSKKEIEEFVHANREWLSKHAAEARRREQIAKETPKLTKTELNHLVRVARTAFTQRVNYYAPLLGVTYGKISVRKQRTRWGSCTKDGNLSFNALLLLAPPEVLDSVVVHELAHRLEMNHSPRFYEHVYRVFPEYKKWDRWLKTNGDALLNRLPAGDDNGGTGKV